MEKDYILNDEEIVLIEKFREEQEAVDRKVKYFNFLSIQEDIDNKTEFISIRTSLFKFLTKVFSIYHRWCDENNVVHDGKTAIQKSEPIGPWTEDLSYQERQSRHYQGWNNQFAFPYEIGMYFNKIQCLHYMNEQD